METTTPFWKRRQLWAVLVGVVALAFWLVGLGAGLRGWMLTEDDRGIVAHAQGFGDMANVWWIPATIITLTAVIMALGTSIVRHIVDGPPAVLEVEETLETIEPLPALEPADDRVTDVLDAVPDVEEVSADTSAEMTASDDKP